MPVTLTNDDFIHPVGRLQTAMFPDGDMAAGLTAWLDEATDLVAAVDADDQDNAAAHWVYYRAYTAIADRLRAMPVSESYGGSGTNVSKTWGSGRVAEWEALAAASLVAYRLYVAEPAISATVTGARFRVF